MTDFDKLLADGYRAQGGRRDMSRLEYLSTYVFDFTTYDAEQDEIFARRAVEVCAAISDRTTFEYIKDPERYRWYLVMLNMPFFAKRTEWGTSVRGAWWEHGKIEYSSCGLYSDDNQITDYTMTGEEWRAFIEAVRKFAGEEAATARFFTMRQNNSQGVFDYNADVGIGRYVCIEAHDAEHAGRRFAALMLDPRYEQGPYCPCCGERWGDFCGNGHEQPEMYGAPLGENLIRYKTDGEFIAFVHYLDGRIEGVR